jgi:hypothetical protein
MNTKILEEPAASTFRLEEGNILLEYDFLVVKHSLLS